MEKYLQEYEKWLKSDSLSQEEKKELESIKDDLKEIESRFFAPLEFGTAGLRGIMGPGLHRMNVHNVRRTTQALAGLIKNESSAAMEKGVAVCYDCRRNSARFAREAAAVLAANGIRVKVFDALRPTPELSFAIRHYGMTAGINITASHNPKEYNGYKVYWSDGAQLPPEHAAAVYKAIADIDIFDGIKTMPYDEAIASGLIERMGEETDELFLSQVLSQSIVPGACARVASKMKIVYTPFHGAGYKLVPEALKRLGLKHIIPVPEQMVTDGTFPTVKSPNPEDKEGFRLAIELAKKHDVDLIIGTDPDADRVGIVLRSSDGEYVTLSGNQVGVLLLDYIITGRRENGTLPENAAAIKTIVTTEMAREVGRVNGVPVFDTFTGFKFMAELIKRFEETKSHTYIFSYEESYGYMVGDHARDKDAVTASVLIAEMAAWYFSRGMTLYDAMQALYKKYGYYAENTINLVMPGLDGLKDMAALMGNLRTNPPTEIAGTRVLRLRDYKSGTVKDFETGKEEQMELSGSNVLYFELEDKTSFIVRPSGTEPKIKVYVLASGGTAEECDVLIKKYTEYANTMV